MNWSPYAGPGTATSEGIAKASGGGYAAMAAREGRKTNQQRRKRKLWTAYGMPVQQFFSNVAPYLGAAGAYGALTNPLAYQVGNVPSAKPKYRTK